LDLSSSGGTYERIRAAYAMLYSKQFSYIFYQQYTTSDFRPPPQGDAEQLNQAKERLGELISQYGKQDSENLQDAFDQFQTAAVEGCGIPEMKIYQYAISILQSPADPPFSPPPL
jgi:hypothetical protein